MLQEYLTRLGLTDKEQALYLVLAEVGVQPASVIARRAGMDRVTTYKNLKKLAERGFVKVFARDNVQCFGIERFEMIEEYLKDRSQEYGELIARFPTAANLLRSLKSSEDLVPRLQMFEGEAGMKSLFRDIVFTIKAENVRQLRMLSTNTFEEWTLDQSLSKMLKEFVKDLRMQHISVELFEATGGLVPERVQLISTRENDVQLPIARGTTMILLVGHTVYLACLKGNQVGLKITQAELSQIFHFLFDWLGKRNT